MLRFMLRTACAIYRATTGLESPEGETWGGRGGDDGGGIEKGGEGELLGRRSFFSELTREFKIFPRGDPGVVERET